jgi:ParB family chromosome partitioning protein
MRLLKLCDEVQKMVVDDMISTGHARALISIEDPEEQYLIAQKIFDEKLSVREVEKLVKDLHKPPKPPKEENKTLQAIYQEISERLKQSLSTKVSVSAKQNGAGKIEIEFYNHEDLDSNGYNSLCLLSNAAVKKKRGSAFSIYRPPLIRNVTE